MKQWDSEDEQDLRELEQRREAANKVYENHINKFVDGMGLDDRDTVLARVIIRENGEALHTMLSGFFDVEGTALDVPERQPVQRSPGRPRKTAVPSQSTVVDFKRGRGRPRKAA